MSAKPWSEALAALSAAAQLNHLDLIVNPLAGWVNIVPTLTLVHSPMPWCSLFAGTPEAGWMDQAPILMRVQLDDWRHKNWLHELTTQSSTSQGVLALVSPLPFERLGKALQGMSQIRWGELTGILRFYDPRVFSILLNGVLGPAQRQRFLELAVCWSWLDRDLHSVCQAGTYQVGADLSEASGAIVLNDDQVDRLGFSSDAHGLLDIAQTAFPEYNREACFAQCQRLVLQARAEHYFGDLRAYATLNVRRPFND